MILINLNGPQIYENKLNTITYQRNAIKNHKLEELEMPIVKKNLPPWTIMKCALVPRNTYGRQKMFFEYLMRLALII